MIVETAEAWLVEAISTLDSTSISLIFVTLAIFVFFVNGSQRSTIPTINAYRNDFRQAKAKEKFLTDAQALIDEGIRKFPDQPFRIITALSDRVFLPYAWIGWLSKHPDLDHQAAVAQDFFGDYPGFDAIGAFNDPNHFTIDLVKKRMSQIPQSMLATFDEHASDFLETRLGDNTEYHDISWGTLCFEMTASIASAVFSGPTLAHDKEWQTMITSHTASIFNAARALREWPSSLRPFVHWVLPDCRALRKQLNEARQKLAGIEADENSVLAWTKDNQKPDATVVQLALAAGAIHTSSQLLQQVVLDLALASSHRPEIFGRLREEIKSALTEGLTPASLAKLTFLDACIKETQRLKPQTLNNLERAALKDVTLPNGQKIRKGTQVAVPSAPMWSEQWGDDASEWNPYRYEKIDGRMNLVSSNEKHFAFGMGRFICPGRFFVAAEIKVILVRMLLGWDLRLRLGQEVETRVKWKPYGFEQIADSGVVVEARRRRSDDDERVDVS